MVHRSGAQPGDRVVVTGTIGDATLGLDILKGGAGAAALRRMRAARQALIARYRVPQPRNALARAVREHASAAMDVSDGLAGDLAKLCAASGVSAAIDAPEHSAVDSRPQRCWRAASSALETLISGGDDYEILCAIPEARYRGVLRRPPARPGLPSTPIGAIIAGSAAPAFLDAQGRELALKRRSCSHF